MSAAARSDRARRTGPPGVKQLPSGRHGLPRAFVVHNQRERMLAAVVEVVSETGYSRMTVHDVISRAGVSRRTFYEHFRNKEEVFLAAYDHVVELVLGEVTAAYMRGRNWVERVAFGVEAFVDFLAKDPGIAHVCIVEVLAAGPKALLRRSAAMERFRAFFAPGLDEAPGGVRPPALVPDTVLGGLYEIVYRHVLRGETGRLPALAPELLYGALVPFVGTEGADRAYKASADRRAEVPVPSGR